ncbi:flavodoxin family protein [Vibrio sp. TRT 21S02]|uniref:flavodoxin family protein n=1 Tax=unclassified Vibrio TaxID=2614977 RepID=UPI00349F857A
MKKKIAIVFFSQQGAVRLLAHSIAEGIHSQGVEIELLEVLGQDINAGRYQNDELLNTIDHCDAVIFGSPTYMGAPASQFKAFMDASSDKYAVKAWRNKLASGFTAGGSINGDQQQTLASFITLACQHGMLWAGMDTSEHTDDLGLNRTGASLGLVASPDKNSQVHPVDLDTAFYHGQRVANLINQGDAL